VGRWITLKLTNNWYIKTNGIEFKLQQKIMKENEHGEMVEKRSKSKYFGTLSDCIECAARLIACENAESDTLELKEYIKLVDQTFETLKALVVSLEKHDEK